MVKAKVLHGMDRSKFRGLKKVEIQFLMTACALNLKKMVKMMDIDRLESIISENIFNIIQIGKSVLRELIKELSAVVALATVPNLCKPLQTPWSYCPLRQNNYITYLLTLSLK